MPRRPPARVRAALPRRARDDTAPIVPGLSPGALAEIRRIERERSRLWPGVTAESLMQWRLFVREPGHRFWDGGGCTEWACCGDPWRAREYLEAVISAMPRRRARELRAIVQAVDDLW